MVEIMRIRLLSLMSSFTRDTCRYSRGISPFWHRGCAGLVVFLALSMVAAETLEGNFDRPWPTRIEAPTPLRIETLSEDRDGEGYRYATRHFEFHAEVRLDRDLVLEYARMYEATHALCRALPLNLRNPPGRGEERFKTRMFTTLEEYHAAGGPMGTSGAFRPKDWVILVPLENVAGRVGGGATASTDASGPSLTLIHEIVHQMKEPATMRAPWFVEGLAEYVTSAAYTHGRFSLANHRADLINYVVRRGNRQKPGYGLGYEIDVPALEEFMNLPNHQFAAVEGRRNYAVAALLVYYFCHMDGRGDGAAIKEYVRRLQLGLPPGHAVEALLDGRSYEELQQSFQRAWAAHGIRLRFP